MGFLPFVIFIILQISSAVIFHHLDFYFISTATCEPRFSVSFHLDFCDFVPASIMDHCSRFFAIALATFRNLPSIPQTIAVSYLKAVFNKTRLCSHVNFLRTCLRNKVIPHGFVLKFHTGTVSAQEQHCMTRVLHSASYRLMKTTISLYNRKIFNCDRIIKAARTQMHSLCDQETSRNILSVTKEANTGLFNALLNTKQNKLSALIPNGEKDASSLDKTGVSVVCIPDDLTISESERSVLSKGLKFVPTKPLADNMTTDFDVEQYFRRLRLIAFFGSSAPPDLPEESDDGKTAPKFPKQRSNFTPKPGEFMALDRYIETCRSDIKRLKRKPLRCSNMSLDEVNTLKELRRREDIVIKPADKGGAVVVWRRDLYVAEAQRQLRNTEFYTSIINKTTAQDSKKVKQSISSFVKSGKLPSEADSLVVKEPKGPAFYMLPKIHKHATPGRPIVSASSCPTELISEFVDSILQPLVASLPSYVKDTNHALHVLEDFTFDASVNQKLIFTMDVSSLYTNIPNNDGLLAIKHFLPQSKIRVDPTVVLRLAELVLTLNSFSFGDEHFSQVKGVAMGTKMGPSYACLFMGHLEENILHAYPGRAPDLYKRFIDDCFGVSTSTKQELVDFINFAGSFHPSIKFTYEVSTSSLPFLDILISVNVDANKLATSVFYKPTDSHAYLNYASSHPQSTKDSIPYSQFLRLRRLCSCDTDFESRAREMKGFFLKQGYDHGCVSRGLERARGVSRADALSRRRRDTQSHRPVLALTYHPHNIPVKNIIVKNFHLVQADDDLKDLFPQPPLVAYRRDVNLRDLLVHSRLLSSRGNSLAPGTHPCGTPGCHVCRHVSSITSIKGPKGEFTVSRHFTCQSTDVIYVVICTLCSDRAFFMYTGETYRTLSERGEEHVRSARLGYNNQVGNHFQQPGHCPDHLLICVVWQNAGGTARRKFTEMHFAHKLGTFRPLGMNIRS